MNQSELELSGGPFFALYSLAIGPLASNYLNNSGWEKLQKPGWLISAMLLNFSQLRQVYAADP